MDSIVSTSSTNKNATYHLEISSSCCILIFRLNIYYNISLLQHIKNFERKIHLNVCLESLLVFNIPLLVLMEVRWSMFSSINGWLDVELLKWSCFWIFWFSFIKYTLKACNFASCRIFPFCRCRNLLFAVLN